MKIAFPILAALALAGCGPVLSSGSLPGPSSLADRTSIDETTGTLATLAAAAAEKAASLAIRTGVARDATTIRRIGEARVLVHGGVLSVRYAYRAGNAADVATALAELNRAVATLTAVTPEK